MTFQERFEILFIFRHCRRATLPRDLDQCREDWVDSVEYLVQLRTHRLGLFGHVLVLLELRLGHMELGAEGRIDAGNGV